jgi:hypothetical protein
MQPRHYYAKVHDTHPLTILIDDMPPSVSINRGFSHWTFLTEMPEQGAAEIHIYFDGSMPEAGRRQEIDSAVVQYCAQHPLQED